MGEVKPNVYDDDEFMMYSAKVQMCPRKDVHPFSTCPYLHPNELAERRDPKLFKYDSIFCFDLHIRKVCSRGAYCPYSHNLFEYFLHPSRYRTRMCEYGDNCKRELCFFAHNEQQLRPRQPVKVHSGTRRVGKLRGRGQPCAAAAGSSPQGCSGVQLLEVPPQSTASPEQQFDLAAGAAAVAATFPGIMELQPLLQQQQQSMGPVCMLQAPELYSNSSSCSGGILGDVHGLQALIDGLQAASLCSDMQQQGAQADFTTTDFMTTSLPMLLGEPQPALPYPQLDLQDVLGTQSIGGAQGVLAVANQGLPFTATLPQQQVQLGYQQVPMPVQLQTPVTMQGLQTQQLVAASMEACMLPATFTASAAPGMALATHADGAIGAGGAGTQYILTTAGSSCSTNIGGLALAQGQMPTGQLPLLQVQQPQLQLGSPQAVQSGIPLRVVGPGGMSAQPMLVMANTLL